MTDFLGRSGVEWSVDRADQLAPSGGFGKVCRGRAADGSEVAVKIVYLSETTAEKTRLRERELQVGGKLDDMDPKPEHLLLRHDFGVLGNDLFIVMPIADHSLAEHLETEGPLSQGQTIPILTEIARGLEELALASILHRDLKPENILWTEGRWKLSDFGLSRDLAESTATFTFAGGGTFPYMAPEVWLNKRVTPRTDLYALGVTMFEILTGELPFAGPEAGDFYYQHLQQPVESPPNLDTRLELLLRQLLSKDAAGRPQDARRVSESLSRLRLPLDHSARALVEAKTLATAARDRKTAEKNLYEAQQEQLKDDRISAIAELDSLLADVSVRAREALDDFELTTRGATRVLAAGNVALLIEFATYPETEDLTDHSPIVHAAAVQALKKETVADNAQRVGLPPANFVCLRGDDGRLTWSTWRMRRDLIVHGEADSTTTQETWLGIKSDQTLIANIVDFWEHPNTECGPLTLETVFDLLADVVRLHDY